MILPECMEPFTDIDEDEDSLPYILAPLRILRRVGSLNIRAAYPGDVGYLRLYQKDNNLWPKEFKTDEEDFVIDRWDLPDHETKVELIDLATGDSPVELLFEMYQKVLVYAQSFERLQPFKVAMALGVDSDKDIEQRFGPEYRQSAALLRSHKNPFTEEFSGGQVHPVEQALSRENTFAQDFTSDVDFLYAGGVATYFKEQRTMIVNFLEPQYKQLVEAGNRLNLFIKQEKTLGGIFDADRSTKTSAAASSEVTSSWSLGLVFLEDYAKSFKRHCPPEFRANFIRHGKYWENAAQKLPMEVGLKQLHEMFETGDFESFVDVFKFVCDDMDKQYLEIRRARKELFAWDVSDNTGCEIDLELLRCDEIVDWSVNEPVLFPHRPTSYPQYRRYGPTEYSGSGWGNDYDR